MGGSAALPHFLRIELAEQGNIIRQPVQARTVEFENDAVALFDQAVINGIGFPEPAFSIPFILAMLAIAAAADEHLFDVGRGIFDIRTVFFDAVEIHAQKNTIVADVNPRKNVFALHPRASVDQHIPTPAISAADFSTEIVPEPDHRAVKGADKILIISGDEVKLRIAQKITQGWLSILKLRLKG